MQLLSQFLRSVRASLQAANSRRRAASLSRRQHHLLVEGLEDRNLLSGLSAITGNFNGTAIPANDYLWFSSVAKVQGLGSTPVTLRVTDQSIDFVANGTPYHLSLPNAVVTLSPTATSAATTFDTTTSTWNTSTPTHFSGNVFLSGLPLALPNGLPGSIHNVTWQMQVTTDTAGVTVNWQWAAAAYSNFSLDETALGVKAVDDNHLGPYQNSDHAGTPEAFKAYVVGGATGGGGSNWTGSLSATAQVTPLLGASLSGFVFNQATNTGISGVIVTLTGVDNLGHTVSLTTTTAANGSYQFNVLPPGTYTITEQPPAGFVDQQNSIGTQGGSTSNNQFTGIALNPGINALNYNFGDFLSGSGGGGAGS